MDAKGVPDLSFATLIEPSGDISPRVIAALSKPDVTLDSAFPRLTYTHRSWRDAEMYFFFNESNKPESRTVTVAGRGQAQAWDLGAGEIHAIGGATLGGDSVSFPLVLGPYEAKVVVVGPMPAGAAAAEPSWVSGQTLAELDGDWTVELEGKQLATPLKSWESLGFASSAGPAKYRRQFTNPAVPPAGGGARRLFLEIPDVHEYAKLSVNGTELRALAWQPYRWEVTNLLKPGSNLIEVEVRATPTGTPAAATPAPATGAGGRGNAPVASSGLLGPVKLVAR